MASLFDQDFQYSNRAKLVARELQGFLYPLYEELLEEGYSPREITGLVANAAIKAENELIAAWEASKIPSKKT